MRHAVLTLLAVVIFGIAAAFAFIYTGVYDVSATRPHWPLTYWAMDTVRVRSVKVRAAGITPPADLMDDARIVTGTEHFAAHCASCHGAPGVPRSDIANGLYPKPADLKQSVRIYTPGELFWIVKNGIKMSGMPSWSDHSDDELWGTIAFIEKLPGMSDADYGKLVMTSVMRGGGRHNHGGGEAAPDNMSGPDHSAMPGMPAMPGMTAPAAPDGDRH